MGKMGRPRKERDELIAAQVEKMAGLPLPHTDIARIIGLAPDTMSRLYAEELKTGRAKAKAFVTGKLFEKIRDGDGASIFFWLKTQCGWRETQHMDHTSSDGSMATPAKLDVNVKFIKAAQVEDGNGR